MKICKRMIAVLLSVLVAIMLLPVTASAAKSIDLEHETSLTISYHNGKTPLTGTKFDIYLVATVDEYGELTPTDTFAQFNVNIRGKNDEAWRALATTLVGYVKRDQITPTDTGNTDDKGLVIFPQSQEQLMHGLYLVIGSRCTQGGSIYTATPFMALLPSLNKETNDWKYEINVEPKFESKSEPVDPDRISRKVLKVWKDEGHEENRPQEVTVQLLQDGKVWDTVILNDSNNWRHTWNELNANWEWTVVEKEMEDYTVEVTREGITFVVTNTYIEDQTDEPTTELPPTVPPGQSQQPDKESPEQPAKEPPDKQVTPEPLEPPEQLEIPEDPVPQGPGLPQTGQLWWPVPVLITIGMLLIVIGLIRRRGANNEA